MGKYGRRAVYTYSKKDYNIYINKQSRRAVRKYTKKYSMQNTKKNYISICISVSGALA